MRKLGPRGRKRTSLRSQQSQNQTQPKLGGAEGGHLGGSPRLQGPATPALPAPAGRGGAPRLSPQPGREWRLGGGGPRPRRNPDLSPPKASFPLAAALSPLTPLRPSPMTLRRPERADRLLQERPSHTGLPAPHPPHAVSSPSQALLPQRQLAQVPCAGHTRPSGGSDPQDSPGVLSPLSDCAGSAN